ncbi:hypothetical protein JNB63_13965 [Microbacterium trichothecenolyticum]|uniref:hypothetical protein n=1 Tax=Microbacterium trichothecenolyticum TaxID=69370 RepID=UPI001C6F1091|nr:hypothetical protein [Microbacterium trichothecenolyticum]MBW9121201.1 hypothetical protein [Microbacterium trichothecenolyticum]
MDAATLAELRTLRARAYGPSADIDQDPAAVQRLHELEARRGAPHAETALPSDPPEPTHEPAPVSAEVTVPEPLSGDDPLALAETGLPAESGDHEPARPPKLHLLSSRNAALWGLSVIAAASLAAGLTYSLTAVTPIDASSGATQIDTLEPDPFIEVPSGWFGAGPSSIAFEYYGLTLFESTGGYTGVGTDCFALVDSEQLPEPDADMNTWSISGIMYNGCRAGSFPATIQFVVDSSAPQQLRDRFPADSALQFVFDGTRIGVFLAPGDS